MTNRDERAKRGDLKARLAELERERDEVRAALKNSHEQVVAAWREIEGPEIPEDYRSLAECIAFMRKSAERERDAARTQAGRWLNAYQRMAETSQGWQRTSEALEPVAGRLRATQDELFTLRQTLDTERQAAVATAKELERVRKELVDLRETYDAEMDYRDWKCRELGAHAGEAFDTFLRRVCAELSDLRDRYRERKQVEEKAPEGEVVLVRGCRGKSWSACWGENVADSAFWTHQPPAPDEKE